MAKTKKQTTTRKTRTKAIDKKVGEFSPNDVKSVLRGIAAAQASIDVIEMRINGGETTWKSGARAGKPRTIKKYSKLIEEAETVVESRKARLIILQDRLKALKALLVDLKKALTRAGGKKSGPKSLAKLLPIMDEVAKVAKVLGIAC